MSNKQKKTTFKAGKEKALGRKGRYSEENDYCICPGCGQHTRHQHGLSCATEICPKCGKIMKKG
ncbi:MAG: hypothetical protein KAJ48_03445 [Elusimicrobiales bacterium]|nr:hypothetical protein [Elusimicrobiales bacterium]